jgi:mono/diheme cytochrome c family protein
MSDATHPDSHGPHDPHGSGSPDKIASYLTLAQFVVTAVLIGAVGTMAYMAGLRSAGGGHGADSTAAAAPAAATADVSTLIVETPELVAQGKALFGVNCTSCHGMAGAGDGAAAAALNPKPRNFTTPENWKFGSGVARIARTLTEGSPGTAMAAYQALPMSDRIALAHYVRSLNPMPDDDKPEDLAWLGVGQGGAPAAGGAAAAAAAQPGPTIPIEKALALLTEAAPVAGADTLASAEDTGEGARLFAARCASCHGIAGQGGVRVSMLGSAPYAYVVTRSLGDARADWSLDLASFERLVTRGLSGSLMPGQGDLSHSALRELYLHTLTLRARQQAAGRGQSS